jgi:TPP-dependent pyruvate/acetoin dehydrogenase alpha subunit
MVITATNYADFKTLASNATLLGAIVGPVFYLFAGAALYAYAFSSDSKNVVVAAVGSGPTSAQFTSDFPLAHLINTTLTLSGP